MIDMQWFHWGGIVVVGLLQGFLNTVAGGGTLLALPALTFLGMDLSMANGTNRISILLQSLSGAASFRKKGVLDLRAAWPLALVGTMGAVLGTFIAINVDKRILNIVVAGLILVMALLLVFKPKMWEEQKTPTWPRAAVLALFFAIGIYGGFIQAGVGFFFSFALVVAGGTDLVRGNAIKAVIIGCYTAVSLAMFLGSGLVHVPIGLVLAAGSMIGAWLGAHFTVAKGNRVVRWVLAVVVVVSAAKMIIDVL
jgi:hypothetical protein